MRTNFESHSLDIHQEFDALLACALDGSEGFQERRAIIDSEIRSIAACSDKERLEFLSEWGFVYDDEQRAAELFEIELAAWAEDLVEKEAAAQHAKLMAELKAQDI